MEEEKKSNAVPECRKNNDLRTFAIALLTAIIVVALYHFGTGLCKIYCPGKSCYYPTQRYMLVPVMDFPMQGMDEGGMHHRRHGKFGMRKPGFRHGGMRPDWKRGPGFFKGKHPGHHGHEAPAPEMPEATPAPAPAAAAPEAKPAPAPAPAPEKKAPAPAK